MMFICLTYPLLKITPVGVVIYENSTHESTIFCTKFMFSTKAGVIVWEGDGRGGVASTTFPYLHHSLECCLSSSYSLVTVSYIDGTGFVRTLCYVN